MDVNEKKKVNDFTIQYDQNYNPTIHSKNSLYPLQYYQKNYNQTINCIIFLNH